MWSRRSPFASTLHYDSAIGRFCYWPDFELLGGFSCGLESAGGVCCLPSVLFGRRLRTKLIALAGTISRAPSQVILAPLFFVCVEACVAGCAWFCAIAERQGTPTKTTVIRARNSFENCFNISFSHQFDSKSVDANASTSRIVQPENQKAKVGS
jgi:hypothetical protein